MEMQGKDVKGKMRNAKDTFRNSHQKISYLFGKILEAAAIVVRAVLFVVIVLAIELCIAGLCYVACGRW